MGPHRSSKEEPLYIAGLPRVFLQPNALPVPKQQCQNTEVPDLISLSVLTAIFPGEPGLADVY